jgi:hypothetical protein
MLHETMPSGELADDHEPMMVGRCPNVCGKLIDPVFNPGLTCQSQCLEREGHSGPCLCPTHGVM